MTSESHLASRRRLLKLGAGAFTAVAVALGGEAGGGGHVAQGDNFVLRHFA